MKCSAIFALAKLNDKKESSWSSGEHTRLACWRARPRDRELSLCISIQVALTKSKEKIVSARRRNQHARRAVSPARNLPYCQAAILLAYRLQARRRTWARPRRWLNPWRRRPPGRRGRCRRRCRSSCSRWSRRRRWCCCRCWSWRWTGCHGHHRIRVKVAIVNARADDNSVFADAKC